MVDYKKTIGSGDEMMIRDTGGNVEFWFHSDQYTWNNQQDWGWSLDGGAWNMGVFKLNTGGAWHHLGTIYVGPGANRQVGMRMIDEGLGWPTSDFFVTVQRATTPPAPSQAWANSRTDTTMQTQFYGNGDGGSAILEWQLAYGTDPNAAQVYVASNGINNLTGLTPRTTYYFWARGRNALGWGAWSPRAALTTHGVPSAPQPVALQNIKQNSLAATFSTPYDYGSQITEVELAYGTDPLTPQSFTSSPINELTGLDAGRVYYFWARARNAYGWGPYSARSQATLVAGARVMHEGAWKRAVPYVKANGEWKVARPWVRSNGVWKETSP